MTPLQERERLTFNYFLVDYVLQRDQLGERDLFAVALKWFRGDVEVPELDIDLAYRRFFKNIGKHKETFPIYPGFINHYCHSNTTNEEKEQVRSDIKRAYRQWKTAGYALGITLIFIGIVIFSINRIV